MSIEVAHRAVHLAQHRDVADLLVLALQAATATWQPLAAILDLVALDATAWAVVAGASLMPAVIGQAVDLAQGRRGRTEPAPRSSPQ